MKTCSPAVLGHTGPLPDLLSMCIYWWLLSSVSRPFLHTLSLAFPGSPASCSHPSKFNPRVTFSRKPFQIACYPGSPSLPFFTVASSLDVTTQVSYMNGQISILPARLLRELMKFAQNYIHKSQDVKQAHTTSLPCFSDK